MRVGSLFSGIGGLDLGLERAGMTVAWQSEIDPYACRVLAKHWPDVPNLGDITTIDWSNVEPVDLICGGYPCQPFSLAGVRQGESDPRHLWPYFADALRVLRPRWALLENVPGHLSLGFGRVLGDLAEIGFDADWDCIPAAAVGAPHLRYRIFVVAHANEQQHQGRPSPVGREAAAVVPAHARGDELREQPVGERRVRSPAVVGNDGKNGVVADTDNIRPSGRQDSRGVPGLGQAGDEPARSGATRDGRTVADTDGAARRGERGSGEAVQRPGPIERLGRRGGSDGNAWTVEPDVGRVAHGVPARVDRLRALGNAVVPQVAEFVGRQILAADAK